MKLKTTFAILLGFLLTGVCGQLARAQEMSLTAGFKAGVRMELGKTAFTFPKVLGTKLDLRAWAGAGATLDGEGRMVGSFAGLVGPLPIAQGLDVSIGVGLLGKEGERASLDGVAHFKLAKDQAAAFSFGPGRLYLGWSRRY